MEIPCINKVLLSYPMTRIPGHSVYTLCPTNPPIVPGLEGEGGLGIYMDSVHDKAVALGISRSNWNLEVLDFVEGGKPENPEKNSRSKERANNKLNPHLTPRARVEPGPIINIGTQCVQE